MQRITLSHDELFQAALVGIARRVESLRRGSPGRYVDGTEWSNDVESCAAELALAKYLDRYWTGLTMYTERGDVSKRLQVRHTMRTDGCLLVRPRDVQRNHAFVLVTGMYGSYSIVGGIRALDAQRPEWERNPGDYGRAWFVPQSALREVVKRTEARA